MERKKVHFNFSTRYHLFGGRFRTYKLVYYFRVHVENDSIYEYAPTYARNQIISYLCNETVIWIIFVSIKFTCITEKHQVEKR